MLQWKFTLTLVSYGRSISDQCTVSEKQSGFQRSNANWDQSKQAWDWSKRVWTLSQSKPASIWERSRLDQSSQGYSPCNTTLQFFNLDVPLFLYFNFLSLYCHIQPTRPFWLLFLFNNTLKLTHQTLHKIQVMFSKLLCSQIRSILYYNKRRALSVSVVLVCLWPRWFKKHQRHNKRYVLPQNLSLCLVVSASQFC